MKVSLILFVYSISLKGLYCSNVQLRSNGYEGIVIAINPTVPENPALLDAIQNIWTEASKTLFEATKNRAYFRNITILVPRSWKNSSYAKATGETYVGADVLVARPNRIYRHLPYTLQHGGCGEPGEYIHLTPDYLLNDKHIQDTGPKDKVIVHEWAHLRWGVFDETGTNGYDAFYLTEGKVQATRCPAALGGKNWNIDYSAGVVKPCSFDKVTWQPIGDCQFVAHGNQQSGLNASFMSHQYLDSVKGFCHSDESDPLNVHNKEAPNEHNRLCSLNSVWDVILESVDFRNDDNPPNTDITDTSPTFNIVQAASPRHVLVMDVSGSMLGNKFLVMKRAATMFIEAFVSDGSFVGLVEFSGSANTLSLLEEINNGSRKLLVQKLPRGVRGSTGIGNGILTGIEVMAQSGYEGGCMVVLTDGGENVSPWVKDVYKNVIDAKIKMATIFLEVSDINVNQIMVNLSDASGGRWYYASGSSSSTDMTDIFRSLSNCGVVNPVGKSLQIHSSVASVAAGDTFNGSVRVDSSIGNNTVFAFSWSHGNVPKVVVTHPGGCVYESQPTVGANHCTDQPTKPIDATLKTIKFGISGTAASGRWLYSITNTGLFEDNVAVVVSSTASDQTVAPIEVDARMSSTNIDSSVPIAVYAKVTQGFSPIVGANVTAVITSPDGTKTRRKLRDNGAGADIRRDDGVYSGFFTQFSVQGRYSLQVKAERSSSGSVTAAAGSAANFNPGIIDENGVFVPNPNVVANLPNNDTSEDGVTSDEEFERVESGGGFAYSGPDMSSDPKDVFPPNKITNLEARQNNLENPRDGIVIQFTAPGDDMDSGNASMYDIRYAFDNASSLVENFNESKAVAEDDVIYGSLNGPNPAASQETIVFNITDFPNKESVRLSIAVSAFDEAGNRAVPSNIEVVTIFLERKALPTLAPEPDTTKPESTAEMTESSAYTTNNVEKFTKSQTTGPVKRTVPDDRELTMYRILTWSLAGLSLIFIVTTTALAVKLRISATKSGKVGTRKDRTPSHKNPYATEGFNVA